MRIDRVFAVLLICLLAALTCLVSNASPKYRVVEVSQGNKTNVFGINDRSQVVGSVNTARGFSHAFMWDRGKTTILPTPKGSSSGAYGINDHSSIAGYYRKAGRKAEAVIWHDGRMVALGTLAGGGRSIAYAINNKGWVVGGSDTGGDAGHLRPFLWRDGKMIALSGNRDDDYGVAYDINDKCQITGGLQSVGHYKMNAFVWQNGKMTRLGALGRRGANDAAYGINNAGVVAGTSNIMGMESRMFLWQGHGLIDIGRYQNAEFFLPLGINDKKQVVGNLSGHGMSGLGFIWQKGKCYLLRDCLASGEKRRNILDANAINNQGEIVGSEGYLVSQVHQTTFHCILLKPVN